VSACRPSFDHLDLSSVPDVPVACNGLVSKFVLQNGVGNEIEEASCSHSEIVVTCSANADSFIQVVGDELPCIHIHSNATTQVGRSKQVKGKPVAHIRRNESTGATSALSSVSSLSAPVQSNPDALPSGEVLETLVSRVLERAASDLALICRRLDVVLSSVFCVHDLVSKRCADQFAKGQTLLDIEASLHRQVLDTCLRSLGSMEGLTTGACTDFDELCSMAAVLFCIGSYCYVRDSESDPMYRTLPWDCEDGHGGIFVQISSCREERRPLRTLLHDW
jgi:hypothetical protein